MDSNNSTESTLTANLDPVDEIASLLAGEDDIADDETPEDITSNEADVAQDDETETPNDSDDAEELEDESNEDEEVNESETDSTLHEMLGISEDQLTVTDDGEFLLNVKVAGKTSQHNLSDVIKSYQLDKSNTQKAQTLAQERQRFEQGAKERIQQINAAIQNNQNLAEVLEREIMAEYNAVNWDEMRQYDPAEYAAKRQDYASKYQRIQRLKGELSQQSDGVNQSQRNKVNQSQQEYLKQEYTKMIDNNPGWNDKDTYNKDMGVMKSTLEEAYGFAQDDFNHVSDSRIIEVLKDAIAYRKGSKFGTKKVVKAPKFQKKAAGKRKPKASRLDRLTKAAKTAQGSQKRDLQTAAVAELLGG